MSAFRKYVFPPLYGLLIYATIRVINDTVSEFKFWERDWTINFIEIGFSIGLGYLISFCFRRLFRHFDRLIIQTITWQTILREIVWVAILTELIVYATIIPMAALTDDGLSWGDVATITILPLLCNLIYYILLRSRKLFQVYIENRLQLEKITNDHLQTELKFLKAQFHPHFLFNALNTIYFQVDENIPAAKKSIEKFSELLRYQLYDQQQTVSIGRELEYLQNFIELQQVRTSDRLQLQVQFDPNLNGQQVYPLLLLPLVENAFKYVGGDYRVHIQARWCDEQVSFRVENSIPTHAVPLKQGGIGLENLKRRLELLYPEKHHFETTKEDERFVALLKIQI